MMKIEIRHLFVSPGHNFIGRHGKEALDHGVEDREEIEVEAEITYQDGKKAKLRTSLKIHTMA